MSLDWLVCASVCFGLVKKSWKISPINLVPVFHYCRNIMQIKIVLVIWSNGRNGFHSNVPFKCQLFAVKFPCFFFVVYEPKPTGQLASSVYESIGNFELKLLFELTNFIDSNINFFVSEFTFAQSFLDFSNCVKHFILVSDPEQHFWLALKNEHFFQCFLWKFTSFLIPKNTFAQKPKLNYICFLASQINQRRSK